MPGLFLFAPQIRCTSVSRASRPSAAAASRPTILIGSLHPDPGSYAVVSCRRWNKRNNNMRVSGEPKTRANQALFNALCWVPLGWPREASRLHRENGLQCLVQYSSDRNITTCSTTVLVVTCYSYFLSPPSSLPPDAFSTYTVSFLLLEELLRSARQVESTPHFCSVRDEGSTEPPSKSSNSVMVSRRVVTFLSYSFSVALVPGLLAGVR